MLDKLIYSIWWIAESPALVAAVAVIGVLFVGGAIFETLTSGGDR